MPAGYLSCEQRRTAQDSRQASKLPKPSIQTQQRSTASPVSDCRRAFIFGANDSDPATATGRKVSFLPQHRIGQRRLVRQFVSHG